MNRVPPVHETTVKWNKYYRNSVVMKRKRTSRLLHRPLRFRTREKASLKLQPLTVFAWKKDGFIRLKNLLIWTFSSKQIHFRSLFTYRDR
ncbi:hypothetical protein MHYP_G00109610 [Metynnis hypsauchen]